MQRPRFLFALIVLAAAAATPAMAGDPPASDRFSTSLGYEIEIGYTDAEGHQTLRTVRMTGVDGRVSEFSSGRRVRFATRTTTESDDGGTTSTSYSYHHVGLSVRLDGKVVDDGRVLVAGDIEISSPSPIRQPDEAPEVATFEHRFHALLTDGVETVLAEIPEPDGGTRTLELTVEVGE